MMLPGSMGNDRKFAWETAISIVKKKESKKPGRRGE